VRMHFDLSELRGYHYQTGIVFAAYVPGQGQEIARGGRYDAIGEVFGRARPATGFSTDLKTLVDLSAAARHNMATAIFAPCNDNADMLQTIAQLRAQGETVIEQLPGQAGDAKTMGCDKQLVKRNAKWVVEKA
jgi:ATP phosphoribosyltransferase regulatory subunit